MDFGISYSEEQGVNDGNVFLDIRGYSGKFLIKPLTSFEYEEEVLFESIAIFQVKGKPKVIPHPTKPNKTVLYVILEQQ